MKLFFNAVFMLVGMCCVLNTTFPMQQDAKGVLRDSLILLNQKLTVLESILVQRIDTLELPVKKENKAELLIERDAQEHIETWANELSKVINSFFPIISSLADAATNPEGYVYGKHEAELMPRLFHALNAMKYVNGTKLSKNNLDSIFSENIFDVLKSKHQNKSRSLYQFTANRVEGILDIYKSFLLNAQVNNKLKEGYERRTKEFWKILENISNELEILSNTHKSYLSSPSSCLIT